jgi:hypothetical protein
MANPQGRLHYIHIVLPDLEQNRLASRFIALSQLTFVQRFSIHQAQTKIFVQRFSIHQAQEELVTFVSRFKHLTREALFDPL